MAAICESDSFHQDAARKFNISLEPIDGLEPSLERLFQALAVSPFADSLTVLTRFKQRFYFPQHGDTDEVWAQWVEPFSSLMAHQEDFSHWGIAFHALEGDRFSPEEQRLGILADAIHDLGEVKVNDQLFVGDIAVGFKTRDDEAKETVVAYAAIEAIQLEGEDADELRNLLHRAYEDVVAGGNEKLHHAHKAREKWDYVRTALHLCSLANSEDDFYQNSPIYSLDWFIARILATDFYKATTQLAEAYPKSIGQQIKDNSELFEAAFLRVQCFLDRVSSDAGEPEIKDNYQSLQQQIDASYLSFSTLLNKL